MNNTSISSFIRFVNEGIIAGYLVFGSTTLMIYASLLHFPDEFEYIWKRKFSFSTLLYLLSKYPVLLYQILLAIYGILPDTTSPQSVCIVGFFMDALMVLSFIGVQGSISARAYALCQKYRLPMTIALFAAFLTALVSNLFVITMSPCSLKSEPTADLIHTISTIVSDVLAFIGVIQVWELWRSKRRFAGLENNTDLLTFLLRQGILRFFPILLITTAEGLFATFGSNIGNASLHFQNVLSTLLICEFTLDLRRRHTQSISYEPAFNIPTLSANSQDSSAQSMRSVFGRLHQSIVSEMGEKIDTIDIDDSRPEKSDDLDNGSQGYHSSQYYSSHSNMVIDQISFPTIKTHRSES